MAVEPLSLAEASAIADGVIDWGHRHESGKLTVAVLDAGGHPVVVKRDDGSEFLRVDIAVGKAWGALGMGLPSRVLFGRLPEAGPFFTALSAASGGRFVPVPGGVIIRRAGTVVGGVGVSGDRSHIDEEAAVAAVEAVGLAADVGEIEEWRRP